MFVFIPIILVILFGLITRRVFLSLILGVVSASLVVTQFNLLDSFFFIGKKFYGSLELGLFFGETPFAESWNLAIFSFLIFLGINISIFQKSGATSALIHLVENKARSRKGLELSSLLLSLVFFVDDYLSSLTVGNIMSRPADKFKVSRLKLAFLVDAMAAPLVILCPFSSWFALVMGLINSANKEGVSPLTLYFKTIPTIHYSYMIIGTCLFIVLKRISFGSMKEAEEEEIEDVNDSFVKEGKMRDFFIGLAVILLCFLLSLLYSGESRLFFGEEGRDFISTMENTKVGMALFFTGLFSSFINFLYFMARSTLFRLKWKEAFKEGAPMMLSAVKILLLAWTLGSILQNDLHLGKEMARIIEGANFPKGLLPTVYFFISVLMAFATGSSWGTSAIIWPLAFASLGNGAELSEVSFLMGATLSGCIAGDHISPISDTTLMTSLSTKVNHARHVQTQMTYAIPVIIFTGMSYFFSSFLGLNAFLALFVCAGLLALFLSMRNASLEKGSKSS